MNLRDIGNALKFPLGLIGSVAGALFAGLSSYVVFFEGEVPLLNDIGDWSW